jgi:hypothetical protein
MRWSFARPSLVHVVIRVQVAEVTDVGWGRTPQWGQLMAMAPSSCEDGSIQQWVRRSRINSRS